MDASKIESKIEGIGSSENERYRAPLFHKPAQFVHHSLSAVQLLVIPLNSHCHKILTALLYSPALAY